MVADGEIKIIGSTILNGKTSINNDLLLLKNSEFDLSSKTMKIKNGIVDLQDFKVKLTGTFSIEGNPFVTGNLTSDRNIISNGGLISAGKASLKGGLDVQGGLNVEGGMSLDGDLSLANGTVKVLSDSRFKENIHHNESDFLSVILNTPVVNYNYKNSNIKYIGLLAQNLSSSLADDALFFVDTQPTEDCPNKLVIKETKLIYILWKALQTEVEERKKLERLIKEGMHYGSTSK